MNIRNNLPAAFLARMQDLLKDEYDSFMDSYDKPPYRGLRFNPLKVSPDRYDEILRISCKGDGAAEAVPWCDGGYYFGDDVRPGIHPYHAAGLYYIQEPSAMLPGQLACELIKQVIRDKGSVRVLDMCAAPGGKATQAAGCIGGNGILVANEPVPGRARILSQNIERLGITNALTVCEMPDKLARIFPGFFDIVIVDAPCSGEGMFRKDDTAVTEWSPENVELCVNRGRDILDAAHTCLKPGGHIVYSTCTYEPAENEEAVARFINEHNPYKVITLPVSGLDPQADGTYRLWPHKIKGEGHFAAVLKNTAIPENTSIPENAALLKNAAIPGNTHDTALPSASDHVKTNASDPASKPELVYDRSVPSEASKLLEQFVSETLTDTGVSILNGLVFAYGDNIYLAPSEIAEYAVVNDKKKRLRIERAGLHLGELKKGRIEPSHSLAMALSAGMCRREYDIPADDDRALKYLRGESLSCAPALKGYVLITLDGYPIGWGKASNGMIKNHYPKGLRYPNA